MRCTLESTYSSQCTFIVSRRWKSGQNLNYLSSWSRLMRGKNKRKGEGKKREKIEKARVRGCTKCQSELHLQFIFVRVACVCVLLSECICMNICAAICICLPNKPCKLPLQEQAGWNCLEPGASDGGSIEPAAQIPFLATLPLGHRFDARVPCLLYPLPCTVYHETHTHRSMLQRWLMVHVVIGLLNKSDCLMRNS